MRLLKGRDAVVEVLVTVPWFSSIRKNDGVIHR